MEYCVYVTFHSSQEQDELEHVAHSKLGEFVMSRMQQYFECIQARIQAEVASNVQLLYI